MCLFIYYPILRAIRSVFYILYANTLVLLADKIEFLVNTKVQVPNIFFLVDKNGQTFKIPIPKSTYYF